MALSTQLILELFVFIFCSAVEVNGLANVLSNMRRRQAISRFRISS